MNSANIHIDDLREDCIDLCSDFAEENNNSISRLQIARFLKRCDLPNSDLKFMIEYLKCDYSIK